MIGRKFKLTVTIHADTIEDAHRALQNAALLDVGDLCDHTSRATSDWFWFARLNDTQWIQPKEVH